MIGMSMTGSRRVEAALDGRRPAAVELARAGKADHVGDDDDDA